MSRRIGKGGAGRDGGFTLVELLVVIVILGILSAVVVFAVRGSGDKGEQAAVDSDARVLRTAQEIHCAQFGRYAENEDELVLKRLLHAPSTYNDTVATPDGSCTASGDLDKSGYSITCTLAGRPGCQGEVTVPEPGQFSLPKALNIPVGAWERAVLLSGLGCEPYCGHVLRVVNTAENPIGLYSAERYDPALDTWVPLGGFSTGTGSRLGGIVLLNGANCGANCGKLLLVAEGHEAPRWWLYDPELNTWAPAPASTWPRNHGPSITLLQGSNCTPHCGKVLAAAGENDFPMGPNYTETQNTAELYDPTVGTTGSWSLTSSLAKQRTGHLAVALEDGSVLVVGGSPPNANRVGYVERFYPGAGSGAGEWRAVPTYGDPALDPSGAPSHDLQLVRLKNGRVLLSGRGVAAIYDPVRNEWSDASGCGGCAPHHRAAVLDDGVVLVTGGYGSETVTQLYDPAANAWHPAATMGSGRLGHSAVRMQNGKVLVIGGDRPGPTASYQIYSPGTR